VAQNASRSDQLPRPYLRQGRVETSLDMTHDVQFVDFI